MEDKWIIPSYTYSTNKPPKEENVPTVPGKYLVVIEGDSEYEEGYCVLSYPSYVTLMDVTIEKYEDEEVSYEIRGKGINDEEWDQVVAWMGPIPPIPEEVR